MGGRPSPPAPAPSCLKLQDVNEHERVPVEPPPPPGCAVGTARVQLGHLRSRTSCKRRFLGAARPLLVRLVSSPPRGPHPGYGCAPSTPRVLRPQACEAEPLWDRTRPCPERQRAGPAERAGLCPRPAARQAPRVCALVAHAQCSVSQGGPRGSGSGGCSSSGSWVRGCPRRGRALLTVQGQER